MKKNKIVVLSLFSVLSPLAYADAFLTGDTDTAPCHEWEFELYGTIESAKDSPSEQALTFEIKRGLLNNLEAFAALSYGWIGHGEGAPAVYGVGDSEIGINFRFIEESTHFPAVSFAPTIMIPTGKSENDLGNGKVWYELPLWLEKSWNDWTTAFGGGYGINSQEQRKNFAFAGWKVKYEFTPKLNLGAEVFYQRADSVENQNTVMVNLGGEYLLSKSIKLEFSAGHSVGGEQLTMAYLGLSW